MKTELCRFRKRPIIRIIIVLLSFFSFSSSLYAQDRGEDTIYAYYPVPLGKYSSLRAARNSAPPFSMSNPPALRIGSLILPAAPAVMVTGTSNESDTRQWHLGTIQLGSADDGNGLIKYYEHIPGQESSDIIGVEAGGFVFDNDFRVFGNGRTLELFPDELYFGCKSEDFGYGDTRLFINRAFRLRNDRFRLFVEGPVISQNVATDLHIEDSTYFTIIPGKMPGDYTTFTRDGQIFLECNVPNANDNLFLVRDGGTDRFWITRDGEVWYNRTVVTQAHDIAEYLPSEEKIESGSVVVINASGDLALSQKAYDKRVAGIISSSPTITMGKEEIETPEKESIEGPSPAHKFLKDYAQKSVKAKALLALSGIVPCRAEAMEREIEPGDILVSSSLPGYAMKAERKRLQPGMIIGKAMERMEKGEKGTIRVLLMAR